jgi:hypothetical protein
MAWRCRPRIARGGHLAGENEETRDERQRRQIYAFRVSQSSTLLGPRSRHNFILSDVHFSPRNLRIRSDLWLDSADGVEAVKLSHGHSGLHGRAWATPETWIYRCGGQSRGNDSERSVWSTVAQRAHGLPAGHILGAAQLLIEHGGERLVYSGDIKLRAPLCGVAAEIAPCDRLIIECTFGLPIYHFLERDDAAVRIVAFARECLDEGVTPVFYGYALGRGQEIVHVLCRAGIPVAVHGAVARFIPLYEQAGYGFDGWQPYGAKQTRGKAPVLTPSMGRIVEARGKNFRVAYVSGWAALANARAKAGAEELIPYSDHGDFSELVAMIERSGARRVDLVHGYTEAFAHILRQRGIDAHAAGALTGVEDDAAAI